MFGKEARIPIDLMAPRPPGEERPSSRLHWSEYIDDMKQRFQKNIRDNQKKHKESRSTL